MAKTGSFYTELPLPACLSKGVDAIWYYENANPRGEVKRVLPDCCVDLIFDLTGEQEPLWVGTMTAPLVVAQTTPSRLMGIRFRPGWASFILCVPLEEIVDQTAGVSALGQTSLLSLAGRLAGEEGLQRRNGLVQDWLRRAFQLPHVSASPGHILIAALYEGKKISDISGWAAEIDVGIRQLERVVKTLVGVTPGHFRSLLRFCAAQKVMKKTGASGAETALAAGYYDQAHFGRDFKRFSGLTPSQYLMSH